MRIHVDINKKEENCFQVIVMILDDESYSNRLFSSPLDYPSDKNYVYVESINNYDYIENLFISEIGAKQWAEQEIEYLKNKLCI